MPFLTLGALTVDVQVAGAQEDPPTIPGATERGVEGALLVDRWGTPKRAWRFATRPLSDAEYAALVAATPVYGTVVVTGDATGAVTCAVTRSRVEHIQDGSLRRRIVSLRLEEV